jgi:signal transduction histidine kinase
MYYQNQNPYGYRNKPKKTYLHKLVRQLVAVLILMLFIMLLKYTNTESTNIVNGKVKTVFNSDYTEKTTEVIKNYSPDVREVFNSFVSKYKNTEESDGFEEETLPVNVSN